MFWQVVLIVLQLVSYSAMATDCLQTQHWIAGVPGTPVVSPSGVPVYERNPLLAGHPEKREPYFRFLGAAVEAVPRMLSPPPAAATLLGLAVLDEGSTAVRNNRFAQEAGWPRYVMLAWRLSW